jgi:anti-sigma28 factor (negative regulator of flagellin synthesis)
MVSINKMPDTRDEKINAVKKAIESGSYNVDSMKLLEKILKEL